MIVLMDAGIRRSHRSDGNNGGAKMIDGQLSLPVVMWVMDRFVDLKWWKVLWKAVTYAEADLDGMVSAYM